MKFKRGDICICKLNLTKRSKSSKTTLKKKDCKVRITSLGGENSRGACWYNVYNIDFNRYEKIGEIFLQLDISENRQIKLNKLLDETDI